MGACGGSTTTTAADGTPADSTPVASEALADSVEIDQVAVFQAVKATIFDNAAPVPAKKLNAPVIAGRPGLVRIHARTIDKTVKRPAPLTGELRVHTPGREDLVIGGMIRKLVKLDDGDLDSTFTFELPAEAFAPGMTLSFTLKDDALPGDAVGVTFPDGPLAVDVKDSGTTLKVKIVPVQYDADGSKRVPDLTQKTLEFYKNSLYKMYPVANVDMTVRDTIEWPLAVNPDGNGWDGLLENIIKLRKTDNVADDVYYAAVFTPAANPGQYCQRGCVLGVAPAQFRSDVNLRVAMIVGFGSRSEGGTLAQEIAHAMGRWHAPCGNPANVDDTFPYDSGRIGTWGYDVLTKDMIDPDGRFYDFMSYCQPVWVSDYTWNGLWQAADDVAKTKRPDPTPTPATPPTNPSGSGAGALVAKRFATVTNAASGARLFTRHFQSLLVDATGALTRGEDLDVVETENDKDDATTVTFEDASGNVVGTAPARFRRTGALRSGRLVIAPDVTVPKGAARIRTADFDTVLVRSSHLGR